MTQPAIGIDLGTTYSALAVINPAGKPEIVANQDGERTTASAVYFQQEGPILIGQLAADAAPGEPDRVVLCVGLKAERVGEAVYDKTYVLDAWGDNRGSAMARLVSVTVALAVESVADGKILAGVSPAPGSELLVREWMNVLRGEAQHVEVVDALA